MIPWQDVVAAIRAATQRPFRLKQAVPVGGGDINQSFELHADDGACYFVKLNTAHHVALFTAEADGLRALAATHSLRVPQVITHGQAGRYGFLVLERLDLGGRRNERRLGEQLAALHRHSVGRFGFAADNYLGTTLQPNAWLDSWPDFWRERRLGHQLGLLAGRDGELQRLGERLQERLPDFFSGHRPYPSLLHGDLWAGNHGYLADGTPVIFDPAAYYGDRECDLAMTELFGGYGPDFYAAYRSVWPLDEGYRIRRELYNLYHILNHAHLFGGSYFRQAKHLVRSLLAETN